MGSGTLSLRKARGGVEDIDRFSANFWGFNSIGSVLIPLTLSERLLKLLHISCPFVPK